ncbi:MAG: sugar transferase [Candidatus Omnitrophica bacterium]|nr:sugar transferase [Candidatus Omnitrophota bacterium]
MMKLAPVCLFTYNRFNETKRTLEALKKNFLSGESDLFIFSDGPKNGKSAVRVKAIREYLQAIDGFKSVSIVESKENKGLADSIISGVTEVLEKHKSVIVLEDDLITTPNFLDFMNQGLSFYENVEKIFSISGYTLDLPTLKTYDKDFYFGYRASSWGWATWKNRWDNVDWDVKDYSSFNKNFKMRHEFMRGGSDLPRMLNKQMNGKLDSWAIRWVYDQFKKNTVTVFASKSKVLSIGFDHNSTNTTKTSSKRFETTLDDSKQRNFMFDDKVEMNKILNKEFKNKFSFANRLMKKVNSIFINYNGTN